MDIISTTWFWLQLKVIVFGFSGLYDPFLQEMAIPFMEIDLVTPIDLRMGRQSCRNLISGWDLATQSELKIDN